jgi:hypothetical protein
MSRDTGHLDFYRKQCTIRLLEIRFFLYIENAELWSYKKISGCQGLGRRKRGTNGDTEDLGVGIYSVRHCEDGHILVTSTGQHDP